MNNTVSMTMVILAVTGITTVLLMASFGVRFTLIYHKRRREAVMEKEVMKEAFKRELLESQLETQNQTLQQIAQELHDNIGQLLTVVVMQLNSLEDEITHPKTQNSLRQTEELVRSVITDVRTLSKTLDYNTVQRFGFLPALEMELKRIQHTGRIDVQLETLGEVYSLGEQTEIVLLRITQESINNTLKHANAKQLTITADYTSDIFVLTIADDGKGFDVHEVNTRGLSTSGSGFHNLHRRTELLGGICMINSQSGRGTRIQIRLPHNQVK